MSEVRSWSYDRAEVSIATGLECKDPSLAIPSQKDEADINVIVRNFGVTGRVPQAVRLPEYGDFDGISDYRTAIEAVRQAEASFLQIPSEIRARFHNDPGAFAEFCVKPENLSQVREWGLAPTPAPGPAEPAAT
jgi:hypothetical protein